MHHLKTNTPRASWIHIAGSQRILYHRYRVRSHENSPTITGIYKTSKASSFYVENRFIIHEFNNYYNFLRPGLWILLSIGYNHRQCFRLLRFPRCKTSLLQSLAPPPPPPPPPQKKKKQKKKKKTNKQNKTKQKQKLKRAHHTVCEIPLPSVMRIEKAIIYTFFIL